MTGIDRLRTLAGAWDKWGLAGAWDKWGLGGTLADVADQIEREQGGRVSRMRVLSVVTEMERHVLGHEGMEDSPVARWAHDLRAALGGDGRDPATDVSVSAYDLLPQDERDAIAWVREQGGLERVKAQRFESMPRAAYERKKAGFLDHIAECETALGRRRETISELNHRVCDLTRENAELRKRAMPEGMEWPTCTNCSPVKLGGRVKCKSGDCTVNSVRFYRNGGVTVYGEDDCNRFFVVTEPVMCYPIERVRRPAVPAADGEPLEIGQTVWDGNGDELIVGAIEDGGHTVTCRYADVGDGIPVHGMWSPASLTHRRPALDADGVPIHEGDRVWSTKLDEPHEWIVIDPHEDRDGSQTVLVSIGDRTGHARPANLTHRAPVFAADGKPLREGETVWLTDGSERHVVLSTEEDGIGNIVTEVQAPGAVKVHISPSRLTHERTDTWERIEEDALNFVEDNSGIPHDQDQMERDMLAILRRCRALAERERGE